MKFRETETVELKAVAQDGIKKEIVAFANCSGGTVYVGVCVLSIAGFGIPHQFFSPVTT